MRFNAEKDRWEVDLPGVGLKGVRHANFVCVAPAEAVEDARDEVNPRAALQELIRAAEQEHSLGPEGVLVEQQAVREDLGAELEGEDGEVRRLAQLRRSEAAAKRQRGGQRWWPR